MNLLSKAIILAATAHGEQLDKQGKPYITHPMRVALAGKTELEQVVGMLHDTVEDTDETLTTLREAGFPEVVVEAVDALSRRSGESYEDFIQRLAPNPLARRVKLNDIFDNMHREPLPDPERQKRNQKRYFKALMFLENYDDSAVVVAQG